jgi:hypothetical protein
MTMNRIVVAAIAVVVSMAGIELAQAQEWRPFNEPKGSCPTCGQKEFDHLKLKNGVEVYARIINESPSFYVLDRYGEQRALGRDQVESIERRITLTQDDRESFSDAILFKDNSVLCGKISEDNNEFKFYKIVVPPSNYTHIAFKSQAVLAYQNGKEIYRAK